MKKTSEGLPVASLPVFLVHALVMWSSGESSMGKEGDSGGSQRAAFTGKGGGEEDGETNSHGARQDGFGC